MGQRGPAPTPTLVKMAHGNRGHVTGLKQNYSREPQPAKRIPSCPRFLSKLARKEWRRLAPELDELGLLTGCDRAVMAAYCQCWARWQQAETAIETDGLTMTLRDDKGNVRWVQPTPEVGIALKMLAAMKGYAVQLGLSPSARSRIQIDGPKAKAVADPLEMQLA